MRRRPLIALGLLAVASLSPAYAEVRRVVSMSICQDVILAHVADREQIAALSHYARDMGRSPIAEFAHTVPITYQTAEEVIALEPDLILASRHSDLATRNALRRLDIRTELFTEPRTVAESLEQIRRIARLVDREERGAQLVAQIEEALRQAAPPPDTPPVTAVLFQGNGFSTGSGSLVNEMMEHAGLTNMARRYGLNGWGNIPLERVIADPPDVLLAGAVQPDMPTWADRVLRHPALRHLEMRIKRVTFPERLMDCGGPVLMESAATLARARELVLKDRP